MIFLGPAQEWDEADPWVMRMRALEASSQAQDRAHAIRMEGFRRQGEAIEAMWAARRAKRRLLFGVLALLFLASTVIVAAGL